MNRASLRCPAAPAHPTGHPPRWRQACSASSSPWRLLLLQHPKQLRAAAPAGCARAVPANLGSSGSERRAFHGQAAGSGGGGAGRLRCAARTRRPAPAAHRARARDHVDAQVLAAAPMLPLCCSTKLPAPCSTPVTLDGPPAGRARHWRGGGEHRPRRWPPGRPRTALSLSRPRLTPSDAWASTRGCMRTEKVPVAVWVSVARRGVRGRRRPLGADAVLAKQDRHSLSLVPSSSPPMAATPTASRILFWRNRRIGHSLSLVSSAPSPPMAATPTASRMRFSISGRGRGSRGGTRGRCPCPGRSFFAVVGVPGARLVDDLVDDAHVDDLALAADAFAVEDVELGRLERGLTLFLTTLTLVPEPMTSSPFLMEPMRRMSRRTEE